MLTFWKIELFWGLCMFTWFSRRSIELIFNTGCISKEIHDYVTYCILK